MNYKYANKSFIPIYSFHVYSLKFYIQSLVVTRKNKAVIRHLLLK